MLSENDIQNLRWAMWYCGDDSDFWDCYWSLSMLLQWLRSLFLSGFLSTCHYLALSHIPWSNPLISNYIVHSTLLKSSNTSNTSFNFHFNPVLPFLFLFFTILYYWILTNWMFEYWLKKQKKLNGKLSNNNSKEIKDMEFNFSLSFWCLIKM